MALVTEIKDYSDERGNRIIGTPKVCQNARINFTASNCLVEIADGVTLQNCGIEMSADGGVVRIGRQSAVKCAMRVGENSSIIIGERLSSTGGGIMSAAEGTSISIGDDCLFAVSMDIRTDHSHPIFDRRTRERLNKSKSLTIGNHVWLGPQVLVYPGAKIGEGCVIGARSMVRHELPPNCVAVGVPARVTRRNIIWDKRHVAIHKPLKNDSLDDIGKPWESAFPVEDEPIEFVDTSPKNVSLMAAAMMLMTRGQFGDPL